MENKITSVFKNELLGKVVEAILSKSIYVQMNGNFRQDREGCLYGHYSFFYKSEASQDLINVSSEIDVIEKICYGGIDSLESLDELLKKSVKKLNSRKHAIRLYGYGSDVVACLLHDFSRKLFRLGIIGQDQVLVCSSAIYHCSNN